MLSYSLPLYKMKKEWNGLKVIYEDERYLEEVLGGEYKYLFEYPIVIDIGANIGTFSFYMLEHARKIYAIEPVQKNIDCMTKTIEENKLTEKVFPFQLAIAGVTGTGNMLRDGNPSSGGWKLDITGDYPVHTETLLDFMNRNGIDYADLVKMDVEGEELNILLALGFPSERVGTIIGEIHPRDVADVETFNKRLDELGYRYRYPFGNCFIARKR